MSAVSENVAKTCTICFEDISSHPVSEQEKERTLNCSHIFHNECIGEWLLQKHNCPVCRAHVDGVITSEAPPPEMTLEEINQVPDSSISDQGLDEIYQAHETSISHEEMIESLSTRMRGIRHVRRVHLNENTPMGATTRKVYSVAARIFGW